MNWRSMDDLPAIAQWRQREFRTRLRAVLGVRLVLAVLDGALRPVADIRQGDDGRVREREGIHVSAAMNEG